MFGVAARLRRAGWPCTLAATWPGGTLARYGLPVPTGSAWLDEQGTDEVLVRRSRSAGLRPPARRARTGPARPGRREPQRRPAARHHRHTTVPAAPAAADDVRPPPDDDAAAVPHAHRARRGRCLPSAGLGGVQLRVAGLTGPWRRFATLDVRDDEHAEAADGPDTHLRFDPVLHPLPGLVVYDWVARLREPSYARSREAGGA